MPRRTRSAPERRPPCTAHPSPPHHGLRPQGLQEFERRPRPASAVGSGHDQSNWTTRCAMASPTATHRSGALARAPAPPARAPRVVPGHAIMRRRWPRRGGRHGGVLVLYRCLAACFMWVVLMYIDAQAKEDGGERWASHGDSEEVRVRPDRTCRTYIHTPTSTTAAHHPPPIIHSCMCMQAWLARTSFTLDQFTTRLSSRRHCPVS